MPEYTLVYFDCRAVGEPIRWMFAAAKVPFKDERISLDKWAALKPSARFPMGQLPVVEVDGKALVQSYATGRYLAKQLGFSVDDAYLNYLSEQASATVDDCRLAAIALVYEVLGENKPARVQELKEKAMRIFPNYFPTLEKIVNEIPGGKYITGDNLTHGDFVLGSWLNMWEDLVSPNILDEYPGLRKHKEALTSVPEIQEWIRNRPKTLA